MSKHWFIYHSLWHHLAAPIWTRIPERHRWTVVHWLDKSRRRCWANLVSDALTLREDDACDTHVPSLRGDDGAHCRSVCDWMHPTHSGEHDCSCYCGKFQFAAHEGGLDRRAR